MNIVSIVSKALENPIVREAVRAAVEVALRSIARKLDIMRRQVGGRAFRCPSGKRRFRDHPEAVEALHHSQLIGAEQLRLVGTTNRRECRAYDCASCRGWHLTSRP